MFFNVYKCLKTNSIESLINIYKRLFTIKIRKKEWFVKGWELIVGIITVCNIEDDLSLTVELALSEVSAFWETSLTL